MRQSSALRGDGLVLPAAFEDEEYVVESLQGRLCSIIDDEKCKDLLSDLDGRGLRARSNRLQELRDPSVCHRWLWKASPVHGPSVPSCEFLIAVRLRLGAACHNTLHSMQRAHGRRLRPRASLCAAGRDKRPLPRAW